MDPAPTGPMLMGLVPPSPMLNGSGVARLLIAEGGGGTVGTLGNGTRGYICLCLCPCIGSAGVVGASGAARGAAAGVFGNAGVAGVFGVGREGFGG
ncbi:hypothetical protein, partial [Microbispora siamensis]|uniref:hypothetical protein n=1 Tax=Microbispora siamensis TaxID=564413 RepID=UPI0035715109